MSGRQPPSGLASLTELHASAAAAERSAALQGRPFAVVMTALEGLALVNARDGYAAGDALLDEAATAAVDIAHAHAAVPGRHGGARLALVLPGAGEEEAGLVADALREAMPAAAAARIAVAVRRPAESSSGVIQRARDGVRSDDAAPAAPVELHLVAERESRRR